jgi:LMBR1 domain-containing protein 1
VRERHPTISARTSHSLPLFLSSAGQRLASAALWTLGTTTVAGAGAAVAYVFGGVADYPVTVLSSGLAGWGGAGAGVAPGSPAAGAAALLGPPAFSPAAGAAPLDACIPPGTLPTAPALTRGRLCDAVGGATPVTVWAARVGFPTYAVALAGTAGWALFLAFAGVGLVALPADLVRAWAGRPRATIPRSEYARRAAALGARAAAGAAAAGRLRAEERGGGGGGGGGSSGKSLPRAALRTLRLEVDLLEADTAALEAAFPRGEDPAAAWALTVLGFWARLVVGVVSGLMTAAWVVHLALAVFPRPPLSPVLNDALAGLDRAAPLLGTAAFAALCFHLVASTLAGCARVGLALGLGRVHPMVRHGTHASGLLFNGGLALLGSGAAVQFTAQAFAPYAGGSVIHEIWGGQVR